MREMIIIDESKCTNCGLCVKVCLLNNDTVDGKMSTREKPLLCAACGHCVAICPTGAITHPDVNGADCEALDEANRPSYEQFMGFLKMRRSRREFKDQPVPREVIEKLLAAAAEAPNGLNRQNVCYTVIADRQMMKQMSEAIMDQMSRLCWLMARSWGKAMFRFLQPRAYRELEFFLPLMDYVAGLRGSSTDLVAYDAPCCILVHTTKDDMCGAEDSVFAAANIQYAAETLGLGTCCIGFITGTVNADKSLKKLVGLPPNHKVQTCLIVGYPEFKYAKSVPKAEARVSWV